jgi:hypothetical protein
MRKSGFYQFELPEGLSDPDSIQPPILLAETDIAATVLTFVAGGMTAGRADEAVIVGANSTHFYHRSAPASTAGPLVVKPLPTAFVEPAVLRYNETDGTPYIGPVSHGQTVFLAVDPTDSHTAAVTGWSSVLDNSAGADAIWLTRDAGDTWTDVTGDLTAATATVGRARPSGMAIVGDALLVGTVSGVYVSWPAKSPKWARLGLCEDLPLVLVMSLSHEPTSDTLVAATFGRGIYVLPNATQVLTRLSR